jgi:hypothetical protein
MLEKLVIVVLILIGIASASHNARSMPDETWWQTPKVIGPFEKKPLANLDI